MKNQPLTGKVALVTGASRGIGKDVAFKLADAGATVIVNYNNSKVQAAEIVAAISEDGGKAFAVHADVSKEAAVNGLFRQINELAGSVDILVNNAGMGAPRPLLELTLADFQEVIDNNLTSTFLVTQAALPEMIAKNFGRIINMSSIAAQLGGVIGPHYAASKAGQIGLTHSYAALLSRYGGITSNAIAPALIETEMITNNPNIKPTIIPIGRFGKTEEVSDIVLLLATNGYINGQTISVNGGWYMS